MARQEEVNREGNWSAADLLQFSNTNEQRQPSHDEASDQGDPAASQSMDEIPWHPIVHLVLLAGVGIKEILLKRHLNEYKHAHPLASIVMEKIKASVRASCKW